MDAKTIKFNSKNKKQKIQIFSALLAVKPKSYYRHKNIWSCLQSQTINTVYNRILFENKSHWKLAAGPDLFQSHVQLLITLLQTSMQRWLSAEFPLRLFAIFFWLLICIKIRFISDLSQHHAVVREIFNVSCNGEVA